MSVLLDSDFLVALYKQHDSNHQKAIELFKKLEKQSLTATNLVVQESTTVISKQMGMPDATIFYNNLGSIVNKFVILDIKTEKKAWNIFLKQTKKGTSFVDCANLAVLKEYNLDKIVAFDKFYPKEIVLK